MNNVWNTIGVFALGGVGWLVTSFVGRPFRQFFDLRSEVIHQSVLYANVAAVKKEFPDGSVEQVGFPEDEIKRLREAESVFRDLAARMRAFALNEHLAAWFVKWRYDPWEASKALLSVSNTLDKYGLKRRDAKKALERALNFRLEMSQLVLKRASASRAPPASGSTRTTTCSMTARSSGGSKKTLRRARRPSLDGSGPSPQSCRRSYVTHGTAATMDEAKAKFRAAWEKAKTGSRPCPRELFLGSDDAQLDKKHHGAR